MTGLGVFVLLTGAVLLLAVPAGRLGRTSRHDAVPGKEQGITDAPLILDLVAAMLSAGGSVEGSLMVVAESCTPGVRRALIRVHAARLLGASWEAAWVVGVDDGRQDAAGRRSGPFERPDRVLRRDTAIVVEVHRGLRFATATGAPSSALLHTHAAQLRRRHNREVDRRAAALGVQLVLPLGLCSLPAFLCLGVVPVVLGLLPSL